MSNPTPSKRLTEAELDHLAAVASDPTRPPEERIDAATRGLESVLPTPRETTRERLAALQRQIDELKRRRRRAK
jgi:hypothetical protein